MPPERRLEDDRDERTNRDEGHFSQNENVTNSRTGSPTTIRMPVASSSHSEPVSHGPKRLAVCPSV